MIVFIVIGILAVFAVVTVADMDSSLLAPSGYPPLREIFSSVALTFFAVPRLRHHDVRSEGRFESLAVKLPSHVYLALGIATVSSRVAVSLGVFATLTVEKVISFGWDHVGSGSGAQV